ncbi:MAG: hypothetical protein ACM3SM_08605 [Bacteroidota bacterium]
MNSVRIIFFFLILSSVLFSQDSKKVYKTNFGFTFGRGFSFLDPPKGINVTSIEFFLRPGLRNCTSSRWASQWGASFIQAQSEENIEDSYEKEKKDIVFFGLSYLYGKYFYIADSQGLYAYGGAGFGAILSQSLSLPMILPQIGLSYRNSIILLDLKCTLGTAGLSAGLIF